MTTRTTRNGSETSRGARRVRRIGPALAALAACAGCTLWTTRTIPMSPEDWNPADGVPPELRLEGHFDPSTGDLLVSLYAVLPPGADGPRVERCARRGDVLGATLAGVAGAGVLGLGLGLVIDGIDGTDRPVSAGWLSGMRDIGRSAEIAGGAVAFASGLAMGALALLLGTPDESDEPECSIAAPADGAVPTAGPTAVAVESFVVRVVRPDGTQIVRRVTGNPARLPLEPFLYPCPGDCLATTARRAAGEAPPERELRCEQLSLEAVPIGGVFETTAPRLARGGADVALLP